MNEPVFKTSRRNVVVNSRQEAEKINLEQLWDEALEFYPTLDQISIDDFGYVNYRVK